jgi:proline iminopeptidase
VWTVRHPLDGPVTEDDLIADFEALRETLGIDRWSILGHSYGGRLALRYGVTHPGTVAQVIFENPPWDMVLATRTLVDAALPLLVELGEEAGAEELLRHEGPATPQMWMRGSLWFKGWAIGGWRSTSVPTHKAWSCPPMNSQRRSRLAPAGSPRRSQPALLIKGGHDPVTSTDEIDLFQAQVPNGHFQLFDTAGHFVHAEQPEAYARLVTDFILG